MLTNSRNMHWTDTQIQTSALTSEGKGVPVCLRQCAVANSRHPAPDMRCWATTFSLLQAVLFRKIAQQRLCRDSACDLQFLGMGGCDHLRGRGFVPCIAVKLVGGGGGGDI